MKVLALLTDFKHHGSESGYKQILKFLQPTIVVGVDERKGIHVTGLRSKYQWLFEWDIRRFVRSVDLIHIMYGEDYFRFSPWLYPKTPIVATFHQPAEALQREIERGDLKGRVGRITHALTKKRFSKLAAAIVTEASQKTVLMQVMPEDRIHVIPLGVHLSLFHQAFHDLEKNRVDVKENQIITVGNWLRDWEFYIKVVEWCLNENPQWRFILINRKLDEEIKAKLQKFPNIIWKPDVDSDEMKKWIFTSKLQFLPVTAASGNNALLESLALGCPVILTDVFSGPFFIDPPAVVLYKKNDLKDAILKIQDWMKLDQSSFDSIKRATFARSSAFDWVEVAKKTKEVYQSVLKK